MPIDETGADGIERGLTALPAALAATMIRAHYNIATMVEIRAKRNAPISPSLGQLAAQRTTTRKVSRKRRATSRPARGGLQNSIDSTYTGKQASVFVSANSPAGKYAYKIHEEKGQTWHKRGPGTRAKGPAADHEFIKRAVETQDPRNENEVIKAAGEAITYIERLM